MGDTWLVHRARSFGVIQFQHLFFELGANVSGQEKGGRLAVK
jgi:hypothetical protein